jgi:excinuclease UvrABC ATPase subunit
MTQDAALVSDQDGRSTPVNELNTIRLRGVRQHNLRGFDLDLAKRSLIVAVGVSGSGKSSLVFDTIAAEAQRQINATFSAYAQNYLPSMGRPDADRIENLSAAIVVDQRRLHGGPRSTVATVTDIGDWMRLLFARGAQPSSGFANSFSFNDPAGMCLRCHGLGVEKVLDVAAFLDESRSLREGPFRHPEYRPGTAGWKVYATSTLFDSDVPLDQYSAAERRLLLEHVPGAEPPAGRALPDGYEGVLVRFRRVQLSKDPAQLKGQAKRAFEELVTTGPCGECAGSRLNEAARQARLAGMTLPDVYGMQVGDLVEAMRRWDVGVLGSLVHDIVGQLERLVDLGLGYLSLDRDTASLSGGEAQRVKMVRHLGSTLSDMLYVFDEPTTGLHARDVDNLGRMLLRLRDHGNTVLVVEHDRAIMAIADQVIEVGPEAGRHGGELLFQGRYDDLAAVDTPTGRALRSRRTVIRRPRTPAGRIAIRNARSHNLQDVSVDVPVGVLTAVTGVAGSGKSSLVHGHLPVVVPDAVFIDQSAIRGSKRSTPASWTGMLDEIRALFAQKTGQPAGIFSPNSDGGCRACEGTGVTFIDLGSTEPAITECEACEGRRFRPAVLKYQVQGRSIADVFEMTVEEAAEFFSAPRLQGLLRRTTQVGLGYLALGQNLMTLSGGERQRLKLARELNGNGEVIVLDEPTTGLHAQDVERLLDLLHEMVDDGRTVIVIEHDLDVIAAADHVIDLGPDGGHEGGRLQFSGTVADLLGTDTHTGAYLRAHLDRPSVTSCS